MIIDDHPIIHDGLRALLASEDRLSIDAAAASATEALKILTTVTPDLAIIDLSMDDSDGSYLIQKIHHQFPKVRMLVYTMSEERLFGERVASAGARGYVMKTSRAAMVKEAIYSILAGEIYFSPDIKDRVLNQKIGRSDGPASTLDNLSNREMDIFNLVGQGLNTAQISEKFNISRNTVDTHRINVKKKLDLPNGKALDRLAYEVVMKGKLPPKK
jgi:DNA-binding NarL/FixJ family response regulator